MATREDTSERARRITAADEWNTVEHPWPLFHAIGLPVSWQARLSDLPRRELTSADVRRLRLFACACCRHVWDKLTHPRTQCAVGVAEKVADGWVDAEGLTLARAWAVTSRQSIYRDATAAFTSPAWHYAHLAVIACSPDGELLDSVAAIPENGLSLDSVVARPLQAHFLRDLYPNPFRMSHPIEPAWLHWDRGVIQRLAQNIRARQDYTPMPILGDALEEAGCTDPTLLNHCRHGAPHVRGCWLIDALTK